MTGPIEPDLLGVILAGGHSERMGTDKGALRFGAATLVERNFKLLEPFCHDVVVSVRPAQAGESPYRDLPLIFDHADVKGPAAGLLAAWNLDATRALLVLAVDLLFVDAAVIRDLLSGRDSSMLATAFVHPNGPIEPLCTIFEPAAAQELRRLALKTGAPSLRRFLEDAAVSRLVPADAACLQSVNTPEALAAARGAAGRL